MASKSTSLDGNEPSSKANDVDSKQGGNVTNPSISSENIFYSRSIFGICIVGCITVGKQWRSLVRAEFGVLSLAGRSFLGINGVIINTLTDQCAVCKAEVECQGNGRRCKMGEDGACGRTVNTQVPSCSHI